MEVLLKLYDMTAEAADGSTIDRIVTEEYLNSEDYQTIIADRISLGGRTHKDRAVDEKYEKLVGPDDQIMISENMTHFIKKIYTTQDSPFCYAIIEILDPEKYAGERKSNIMNLIADLESGIKIPCSVVIQALWSYDNKCEKIIRIKGVDFTLNPSFSGAGVVKVFSSVMPDIPEASVKSFSAPNRNLEGCVMKTVVFSTTAEVMKPSVKIYSIQDIAKKYGKTSEVYLKSKSYSGKLTDEVIGKFMAEGGSEFLTAKRPEDYFEEGEKDFSTVNSVRDRMYFARFPRIVLINRILKSYKAFYEDKKSTLTDKQLMWLQILLLQDIHILLRNVAPKLISGQNISALYGLQQFGEAIQKSGTELSKIYRQALVSEQVLGFIPEGRYKRWKEAYFNFLNEIVKYCFGMDCTLPNNIINQL